MGPVRAWRDEEEIGLGPRQQRAVLAVLLLNNGIRLNNNQLIGMGWDDPNPSAVMALRTYMYKIRKALPELDLKSRDGGYTVRAEIVDDGEPLEGLRSAYFDAQRVRLGDHRLKVREGRLARELDALELQKHMAAFPLRERPRALLMRALYLEGRQGEALEHFITPAHGLTRTTLGHQRLHIAVASDCHLAARTTVTLPELADEPLMVWGPRPLRLHRPPHRPLPPGRLRTPYRTHRPAGHTPGHRRHRHPPHRLRHHGTGPRRGRQDAHSPSRTTGVRPSPRALPAPDHLPRPRHLSHPRAGVSTNRPASRVARRPLHRRGGWKAYEEGMDAVAFESADAEGLPGLQPCENMLDAGPDHAVGGVVFLFPSREIDLARITAVRGQGRVPGDRRPR
ncbi:regulatory protein AfsR [Streptomyces chrestomyceticus JCM 4735]|uniref:Regulatory protein AfsR n=1 Tax=Streptomyces chrestomyceticus JCM 4735 TaxID=1306181 RepID=A0A7U9KPM4_9ACTN|nr:regulatory protein AfsR [Streptomyces chrestomyceticus JCM 4735]